MGQRDKRVDAYIRKAAPFARPILEHIREVVHAGAPRVTENIKWGMPSFELDGLFCGMAAFKAHATFWFKDPAFIEAELVKAGAGQRDAMGHFGRLTAVSDLPPRRTLAALVRRAAAAPRAAPAARPRKKPAPRTPAALSAALRKNAKARATFEAFPPGKRRDYCEWIEEAKTEATRARRVATSVEWLAQGKSRNWKYERC